MRAVIAIALTGAALAGCERNEMATGTPAPDGAKAVAMLRTAAGADVGRATATEAAGGLRFTVDGMKMPPGTHGAHIHAVGRCDAPTFESAGPHWNPTERKHGSMNPQGPHQGDIPNLEVDTGGRGTIAATVPGATMAGLLDPDGAAFVVHAGRDDLMTDPSGNSGGRIACGVFAPA